jgi:hypothetical protein
VTAFLFAITQMANPDFTGGEWGIKWIKNGVESQADLL